MKTVQCEYCKQKFADYNGRWSHTKAAHKGKPNPHPDPDFEDESFASRAVQAEIDRACGIYNPDADWLLP